MRSLVFRNTQGRILFSCLKLQREQGQRSRPLTPELLLLLDRLEPHKGKQARMLTEHLIGQRTLPYTEQELQTHMERKAEREIKRQHAAAEATTNTAAT